MRALFQDWNEHPVELYSDAFEHLFCILCIEKSQQIKNILVLKDKRSWQDMACMWPLIPSKLQPVGFGSVQFSSRWYLCAQKFPQHCLWNSSNVHLLSSLQGRSSSTSSFHASLLPAIDGVMALALCPQVGSQAPQHFRSSEMQTACLSALSFPSMESSTQQVKDRLVWNMKNLPCSLVSRIEGSYTLR